MNMDGGIVINLGQLWNENMMFSSPHAQKEAER